MRHHHHRQVAVEHPGNLAGVVTGGVHDDFAADLTLGGGDDPFVILTPNGGDGAETLDFRPHLAGAGGERLGQLGGVDVAVVGVIEGAGQVVGFKKGVFCGDFRRREDFKVHALIAAHADDALKLLQTLAGVAEADRACDVIVHRVVDLGAQASVKPGRIALHVHQGPAGGEGGHVAGGVPGGAGGQLVLFQQQAVGPAGLGEVVQAGHADSAAADDDHAGLGWEIGHGVLLFGASIPPGRPGFNSA